MSSPMTKVSSLVSADIGNYLTNKQTWSGVIINAMSIGAKGNGRNDDYPSIQRALNSYNTSTNGETSTIVWLPVGTYLLSESLVIPPFTILVGDGVKGTILKPLGDFPAVKYQRQVDRNAHIIMRDFYVDARNCVSSPALDLWRPIIGSGIYNVRVEGFGLGKKGIYVEEGDIRLSSVQTQSFTGPGIELTGAIGQILIEDAYSEDNDIGLYIHDTSDTAAAVNVLSFHTESCRSYGIYTKNTTNITIRDITGGMVSNGIAYIKLDTGTRRYRIENSQCLFGSRPLSMLQIPQYNVTVNDFDENLTIREINDYYYQTESKQYVFNPQYLQRGVFSGSIPGFGQENNISFPTPFENIPRIRCQMVDMYPDAQVTYFVKNITVNGFSLYTNATAGTAVNIEWLASGVLADL
ncbi:hypothetical protein H7B90_23565 [Cohnella xylanilytica]|uniref:Rhamnogalacturonase A/B/Epimerase-like pectate lyase domain-containing protein n=1 Tax=Cohnella xylanilytica TaxID=557555 RepID=A0A841U3N7_9BACL|nr:glycosyl hydrolase family 28-related protein [Cohnella xylanilytica]MBB6694379.1 hypothetical protein [Cohnella xylanilytica]